MSKKMANKILAAVLSLGAVMNSGSTSSAMEKTGKKNETQNSQRNIVSDYMKSGLGVLNENLSLKDLAYLFGFYKIYDKLKGIESRKDANMNVIKLMEYVKDNDSECGFGKYYVLFIDSLDKMLSSNSNVGAMRRFLIGVLVKRTNKLLVKGSLVLVNKVEVSESFLKEKEKEKPEEGKKEEGKKEEAEEEKIESGSLLSVLRSLSQRSERLSEFIFNKKANAWSINVAVDNVSRLFKNFKYDEIFDVITYGHTSGNEDEEFYQFIESLYNLVHIGKYFNNNEDGKEFKKDLVGNRKSDWDYCVYQADKFLKFCEKKSKKFKKAKSVTAEGNTGFNSDEEPYKIKNNNETGNQNENQNEIFEDED